jgi:hypothetical protein
MTCANHDFSRSFKFVKIRSLRRSSLGLSAMWIEALSGKFLAQRLPRRDNSRVNAEAFKSLHSVLHYVLQR